VGRLDGIGEVLPDPRLFVQMYVSKEAVLSSQIEGTQASLSDLLEEEAGVPITERARPRDVVEVRNYVRALEQGLRRLETLPLSLRLIREIHAVLLKGVRGDRSSPGDFRTSQNWIGPEGALLADAAFVPPPHTELLDHLSDLERFIRDEDSTPVLIRAGLVHAQFETIHPFLDGNGRLGRLLVTFMLCECGVLRRPLLYLSDYLTRRKSSYYDWLMRVREDGDWEGWLRFFLEGVAEVAGKAAKTAHEILALQGRQRELVRGGFPRKANLLRLLEATYRYPTLTVGIAASRIGVSIPTANTLVADLQKLGILTEVTGRDRDRVFRSVEYLRTLSPGSPTPRSRS